MKKLKELLVVISLFLTIIQTSYCIEADNKNEIVASAQAVTKDMYENANYVIVYQKESVEYEETGKYKSENDVYIKVLDEKGKNDNSTIVYSYDKNYGKSDVNLVEVISENGVTRKINIEANKSEQMATGESVEEVATSLDMESILHLCKLSSPVKMLKWHYRSRHESLISVSIKLVNTTNLLY